MAIEQYTETLTLKEMKCSIGANSFGYVFPQGDVADVDKIETLLRRAGGKPRECGLNDYSQGGNGKAKPEYIITFNDDIHTIIVVECKNTTVKHCSRSLNKPSAYAVDGVLYYAKFLKQDYNVIAIAVSGTTVEKLKADTFYWPQGQESYTVLEKAKDIILEPQNYLALIKGDKLKKGYSLDEIRNTAIDMHNFLREIKVTETHKPVFIAGILIALNDEDFLKSYSALTSYKLVMQNIQAAIENVLKRSEIRSSRISYIKQVFATLQENTKFAEIPLGHSKSITWYIEQLEMKIKPMMDYADSSVDALGVFYHEFIKYSGGDGSGLGIVLTPQHLTEFMCDLAGVNKNSRVVDICCGSGSFLVTAMSKMFKDANPEEVERIRRDGLYGVEFDDGLYTLAIANMIIRKDGKSNVYKGDCFHKGITEELKGKHINIGLINPPYSQKDVVELEFVEHLLDILTVGGTAVVVVPVSCAIGTKYKDVRERLMKKNTLKAVFSMPDDIFYPAGTNVCVMVWEAHTPHDSAQETFFGYCKDDGFVKRKRLGRVDVSGRWEGIEREWLRLYRNRDVKAGLSARHCVTCGDEWLCEAYMQTDYSSLTQDDFRGTVNRYLAYLVREGRIREAYRYMGDYILQDRDYRDDPLNFDCWNEYKLGDLFDFSKGKRLTKAEMVPGTVNFLGAISENNGIREKIETDDCWEAGCITVNYNGSVGEAFYQDMPFWASDDVNVLYAKPSWHMNPFVALFLVTVIRANKYRFSYGRKWTLEKMRDTIIRLPGGENGMPDFEYMERYMKSLPYAESR